MIELFKKKLIIKIGDITEQNTDVIVNAANPSLMGGGGVDGMIHKKGGPKILEECIKIRKTIYPEGLPTSKTVVTSGGLLKSKYIIHTVGPIWKGGNENEENLLYDTFLNCMKEAEKIKINSISFPFISTGAYGFPKNIAAKVILNFFENYYKEEKYIITNLILFSNDDYQIFYNLVNKK
ncbi:MAG: macro domain-containing protein [Spirochaetes bacterium]|nr:macro domain-containing protein [Spirochaetota bacterium]